MKRLAVALNVVCLTCWACQQPAARLNAPPHGTSERPSQMRDAYTHMIDNGLLVDMSISDVHFLPHRAALSTLGVERLTRLAALLEAYGGTIRFTTSQTDEELVDARTRQIMSFLSDAGIDTTAQVLVRDLPGGRGMDAGEAILIKANEATYRPKKDKGSETKGSEAKSNLFQDSGRGQ